MFLGLHCEALTVCCNFDNYHHIEEREILMLNLQRTAASQKSFIFCSLQIMIDALCTQCCYFLDNNHKRKNKTKAKRVQFFKTYLLT